MRTIVLTISAYFPMSHRRVGDKTNFESSIENKIKLHTIRANYRYWKKQIDQVIEGKAELSIREWTGKPYNSPQKELFRLTKDDGVGIEKLHFEKTIFYPWVGEKAVNYIDLAENDGLVEADFLSWFRKYPLDDPMAIIHFTHFRYNKA